MLAAYGDAGTHVNWTGANIGANTNQMRIAALDELEDWLDAIEAAGGPGDRQRTIDARPAGLEDGCFDAQMNFISEVLDYDDPSTACNQLYPYHSQPRAEAGMPLIADGLKCALAPLDRADYAGVTDAQWARLVAAFPSGVCDWSQRPQGVKELEGTWLEFGETQAVAVQSVKIDGLPRVGKPLTAVVKASGSATVSYQWIADGVAIDGAVEATFVPTVAQQGAELTVRVTVSEDGLVAQTLVSDPTHKVKKANGKP